MRPDTIGTDQPAKIPSRESRTRFPRTTSGRPRKPSGRGNLERSRWNRDPGTFSLRKEVIQPQVLLRLPCYDFTPIMDHTLGLTLLAVGMGTSSTTHFRDVTGGVYKARERIHGAVLMRHY